MRIFFTVNVSEQKPLREQKLSYRGDEHTTKLGSISIRKEWGSPMASRQFEEIPSSDDSMGILMEKNSARDAIESSMHSKWSLQL